MNIRTLTTRTLRSAVVGSLAALWAVDAYAFVCNRTGTQSGPALSWASREVPYVHYELGTEAFAGVTEFEILDDAFDVWATLALDAFGDGCAAGLRATSWDMAFVSAGTTIRLRVGYDYLEPEANENLLVFVDDGWPHDANVIALTTTTFVAITGEIIDADIEFNTDYFDYRVVDRNFPSGTDLLNSAVHEIGHFVGLGHVGNPAATMFASATAGETFKRDLSCDDARGVVFKYPAALENGYCEGTIDSACGFCGPPESSTVTARITVTRGTELDASSGCTGLHETEFWTLGLVLGPVPWVRRRLRRVRTERQ